MKNSFKNLLLYELKRMLFIVIISLCFIVVFDIVGMINYFKHPAIGMVEIFDRVKLMSLYIFVILQIVYLSFRTFADRKFFDYMHIPPEKVFLVRLLLNFCITIIYTLFLLLVGTLSFAIEKSLNPDFFVMFKHNLMFTFNGKSSDYIMFCFNNGFFIILVLCLLNLLQSIVFCKKTVVLKTIWMGLTAVLVYGGITIYNINIVFPYALPFDYYKISVPLGYYDYNLFEHYKLMTNLYFYKEPIVFKFLFTVNILNVLNFISTVVILFLSFASNSYFTGKSKTFGSKVWSEEFLGGNLYE